MIVEMEEMEEEQAKDFLSRLGRNLPLLERVDLGDLNAMLETCDFGLKKLKKPIIDRRIL